jgi:hypothetical protein
MFQVLADHTHLPPDKFSNDTDSIFIQLHSDLSTHLSTYFPNFTMNSESQLLYKKINFTSLFHKPN